MNLEDQNVRENADQNLETFFKFFQDAQLRSKGLICKNAQELEHFPYIKTLFFDSELTELKITTKLVNLKTFNTNCLKSLTLTSSLPKLKNLILNKNLNKLNLPEESLPELEELATGGLDRLTLTFAPKLKKLILGSSLNKLNLPEESLPELEELATGGLDRLTLTFAPKLKKLILGSSLEKLDFPAEGLSELEELSTGNLSALTLPPMPKLKELTLRYNLKKLDLPAEGLPELKNLDTVNLKTLTLTSMPKLKILVLGANLEECNFPKEGLPELEALGANNRNLQRLTLTSSMPKLKELYISDWIDQVELHQNLPQRTQLTFSKIYRLIIKENVKVVQDLKIKFPKGDIQEITNLISTEAWKEVFENAETIITNFKDIRTYEKEQQEQLQKAQGLQQLQQQ
jgi:hypothetical protein